MTLRVLHGGSPGPAGARLITTVSHKPGELIARLPEGRLIAQPTTYSIQIGPDNHLEDLGPLASLNHSCAPNTLIDTALRALRALRTIDAGEELTFFYPSTEWEMASPFTCLCGAPACIGVVAGARDLPDAVLERYELSPHIRLLRAAGRSGSPGGSGAREAEARPGARQRVEELRRP